MTLIIPAATGESNSAQNPDPLEILAYTFSKVGTYKIAAYFSAPNADGSLKNETVITTVYVSSAACSNKDKDSHLIIPEGIRAKASALLSVHLYSCDAASYISIEWQISGAEIFTGLYPTEVKAIFPRSGIYTVKATINYADDRSSKILEDVIAVEKCQECQPAPGYECPDVILCDDESAQ